MITSFSISERDFFVQVCERSLAIPMQQATFGMMTNDLGAPPTSEEAPIYSPASMTTPCPPEVSQRPLTGSPHNFLPCRAHGVQNCGSITPTSPSAVRLLSPISNHPRELTRMDGSHLHVYAPRVAHATIEKQLPDIVGGYDF